MRINWYFLDRIHSILAEPYVQKFEEVHEYYIFLPCESTSHSYFSFALYIFLILFVERAVKCNASDIFLQAWRYRLPFQFSVSVNCQSLMDDFAEDLEFRFSLGLTSLVRRLVAYGLGQPVTAVTNQRLSDQLVLNHVIILEVLLKRKING